MHDALPVGRGHRIGHLDRFLDRPRQEPGQARGSPSRSSITRYRASPSRPTSYSVQTCGWLSDEIARASRWNRCENLAAEQLDGDHAIQARVAGLVHRAHAARPDRRDDLIVTETARCLAA